MNEIDYSLLACKRKGDNCRSDKDSNKRWTEWFCLWLCVSPGLEGEMID